VSILKSKLGDESGFEHRSSHWREQTEEIRDQEETLRLGDDGQGAGGGAL
jgi:hypothetical protein